MMNSWRSLGDGERGLRQHGWREKATATDRCRNSWEKTKGLKPRGKKGDKEGRQEEIRKWKEDEERVAGKKYKTSERK